VIAGRIRIVASSQEEAYEIAGYLHRLSGGRIWFRRPERSRSGQQWLVYGDVEVPDDQDTRTWNDKKEES
jgi:hypothetical protein